MTRIYDKFHFDLFADLNLSLFRISKFYSLVFQKIQTLN